MADSNETPNGNNEALNSKGIDKSKQEIFGLLEKYNIYFSEAKSKNTFDEKYIINNIEYIKPTNDDINTILSWFMSNEKNLTDEEKNIFLAWKAYIDYFKEKLNLSNETKGVLARFRNVVTPSQEDKKIPQDIQNIIDSTLKLFSISELKIYIEKIEKMKESRDRIILINFLIGKLEKEGYRVLVESNQLIVEKIGIKGENNEIEAILNSYINSSREGKVNIEEFKMSLLEKTQYLDTYIEARSDSEGKILNENVSSEDYYNFITDKYKNNNINIVDMSVDEIKNSTLIDEKDKSFLISYKQGAYENFMIYDKVEEYKNSKDEAIEKAKGMEEQLKIDNDKRTIPERIGAFMKNPFAEMGKVIGQVGPVGGFLIIISFLGIIFKNPTESFGIIAGWAGGKALGVVDGGTDFGGKLLSKLPFIGDFFKDSNEEGNNSKQSPEGNSTPIDLIDTGNETKNYFTQKVISNAQFVGDFKEINPGLNNYLNFINNSNFSDNTLLKDVLYPGDGKFNETIFSNELNLEAKLKTKVESAGLNILYFKKVLRLYLTGEFLLTSKDGLQEHKSFQNKLGITKGQNGNQLDMQDKKISEILEILKIKETQK
ncbi:hypothetical protein HGA92_05495 [Candidatus Gracilibacteria bacterium]|nr:hypothetical protein [Candidatus Gracilibacteria bacterium]NUJ98670.1 hypothetical protein [Candidatus Gracilibacteria bacterium]